MYIHYKHFRWLNIIYHIYHDHIIYHFQSSIIIFFFTMYIISKYTQLHIFFFIIAVRPPSAFMYTFLYRRVSYLCVKVVSTVKQIDDDIIIIILGVRGGRAKSSSFAFPLVDRGCRRRSVAISSHGVHSAVNVNKVPFSFHTPPV